MANTTWQEFTDFLNKAVGTRTTTNQNTQINTIAGVNPQGVESVTRLPQIGVDVGQSAANQMFDAQRQSLASQLAASRQAIQGSAATQQRQLAMQLQQAQRDYNLQRQQQQEQAFMQSRQLQQAAQVRGLGQSGLAQLAQLQQGMQQGQLTNQAAQGMQQTRLGYTEQAAANQQNLANQLLQLEANKQAGEAGIVAQQFQTNQALQQQSRDILTQLYSVARAGQNMTNEDWNFLATQYGIAPEYLESLKKIWATISGKELPTTVTPSPQQPTNNGDTQGLSRALSPILNP